MMEETVEDIDLKFKKSVDFLCQAYDAHMQKMAPMPQYLQVRLTVVFKWKHTLENVHV